MGKYNDLICMRNFVSNLNLYMAYNKIQTIEDLSLIIDVKLETLRSWMYFKYCPSLRTLDKIADILKVPTHTLVGEKINFDSVDKRKFIVNDSTLVFSVNLRKFLNKNDIKSAKDFEYISNNLISKYTYYSYFKNSNRKIPSLKMLENISIYLNIEPYKLIERTDNIE